MRVAFRLGQEIGPHGGQPVYAEGAPLEGARAAMILAHGRGADAADILGLAEELAAPGLVFLAPQAAGNAWYPERFTAPLAMNEPWLSSALAAIRETLQHVQAAGITAVNTYLAGFSQGACLMLDYAARNPTRYAGIIGFSGGLIGPDGAWPTQPAAGAGGLAGTPVFLGCSATDPHIPRERVQQAAAAFERLGGNVTMRLYQGMGHTINADELSIVQGWLSRPEPTNPA